MLREISRLITEGKVNCRRERRKGYSDRLSSEGNEHKKRERCA